MLKFNFNTKTKMDRVGFVDEFTLGISGGNGFIPPPKYQTLEKTGFWRGCFWTFRDYSIDKIKSISDKGYGMGVGILSYSVALRGIWLPAILYTQVGAIKMQLLAPEMAKFKELQQKAYRGGDRVLMNRVAEEMQRTMRRYGVSQGKQMMGLTQIPFILWFFWSLNEMAYNPEDYPGMVTDGFLWFKNLSEPDPYFLLPVMLASSTFLNIHKSPTSSQMAGGMGQIARYIKYFTFLAIPITATFPSAMVLNWFVMSFVQLGVGWLTWSTIGRRILRIPKFLPGSILEKQAMTTTTKIVKPVVSKFKKAK